MKQTMHTALGLVALATSALVAASCGGAVTEGQPPPLIGCQLQSDCPTNYLCDQGSCFYSPPACTTSADCGSGNTCTASGCVPSCADGCPQGLECLPGAEQCTPIGNQDAGVPAGDAGSDAGSHDAGTPDAGSDAGTPDAGPPPCTTDTWSNFAQQSFANNCVNCHSHDHSPYSSYSGVSSDKSRIASKINSGSMPQGNWSPASDQARVVKWLSCGLPQ